MMAKTALAYIFMILFLFLTFAYFYKTISVNYKQNVEIIEVEIKGAVKEPGSYYVERGSPISLILNKCGGLTDNGVLPEGFDFSTPLYYDKTNITIQKIYGF